jgi:hypothetical protein
MCVNETYSRVLVGNDIFLTQNDLKQGDALSLLFFKFALEYVYAIRRVEVSLHGFKLNGIHQCMVYADGVNILDGSVHTIRINTDALVVASEEIGLEVIADETKYMVMSLDQNAGGSQNIQVNSYVPLGFPTSAVG